MVSRRPWTPESAGSTPVIPTIEYALEVVVETIPCSYPGDRSSTLRRGSIGTVTLGVIESAKLMSRVRFPAVPLF